MFFIKAIYVVTIVIVFCNGIPYFYTSTGNVVHAALNEMIDVLPKSQILKITYMTLKKWTDLIDTIREKK